MEDWEGLRPEIRDQIEEILNTTEDKRIRRHGMKIMGEINEKFGSWVLGGLIPKDDVLGLVSYMRPSRRGPFIASLLLGVAYARTFGEETTNGASPGPNAEGPA